MNIDEMIFYLKSMYCTHNEESKIFFDDIPTGEPSFEAMTNHLKSFSKCIKDDENMRLKDKCLFYRWILMALKLYRKDKFSYTFEDRLYRL